MHPSELIEIIFVGVTIAAIIVISLFLKGRWRKVGWSLAFGVLVAFAIFYTARPYWIDVQIDQKVVLLESYLEQQFPDEVWTITTVPHRKNGYKHLNPYYIGVVFEDEPDVTYHYWVEKDNIYQISYLR
ncbi:hypothetical protein H1D32_22835 [Anaerobacillus sp. CMMVII]|uniref:hypothetical protein n=1 Tax=Anaerobacillus sp. CMMVII TaxID=2755588 RepID=UPI0021B7C0D2|nr:hypothetical protein [Anaerobacillus sp. CMMVII]MCT8140283.1 hypothetical protein [Anaerobacillus sp. CMMVII]